MVYKKDRDLEHQWQKLLFALEKNTGKKPSDLNSVLFLIGVQELGKGKMHFSKEEKQDLLHIGTCKVLSLHGFYELEGLDDEGWPHWKKKKTLPHLSLADQEKLLKMQVLDYFKMEIGLMIDFQQVVIRAKNHIHGVNRIAFLGCRIY